MVEHLDRHGAGINKYKSRQVFLTQEKQKLCKQENNCLIVGSVGQYFHHKVNTDDIIKKL